MRVYIAASVLVSLTSSGGNDHAPARMQGMAMAILNCVSGWPAKPGSDRARHATMIVAKKNMTR